MGPVLQHGVVHTEGRLQPTTHEPRVQYATPETGVQDPAAQARIKRSGLVAARVGAAARTENKEVNITIFSIQHFFLLLYYENYKSNNFLFGVCMLKVCSC